MPRSVWAKKALAAGGTPATLPANPLPQLVLPYDKPFDDAGWIFELKWDGYRCIAVHGGQDRLISRSARSLNELFPRILASLSALPCPAVVDGEIVALDDAGQGAPELLQYSQYNSGQIYYYLFDLLHLDGVDLTGVPLIRRKILLLDLLAEAAHPRLLYTDFVQGRGCSFFDLLHERGADGMVAKDAQSLYQPGQRPPSWLKIKAELRQHFVIVGYTSRRNMLDRLLLASHDSQGRLQYSGSVGHGLDPEQRADLQNRLDGAASLISPLAEPLQMAVEPHWARPELYCEVKFVERTPDGELCHAVFLGLRDRQEPGDVLWDFGGTMARDERHEPHA